jgi:pimeloyl-ACP methyl ester carboxylesterase
MSLEQFISDTRELSEILAKRFGKEKIYVMGHSWGSLLGILTAYRYPELFHAYLGCGQVCNQYKGEKVSFEWVRKEAAEHNDKAAVTILSEMNFPDSLTNSEVWLDFLGTERKFVNRFGGGITHDMTGMWPAIKLILKTKEYTFREKLNYMPANMFSLEHLWAEVMNINLSADIDSMQIPVYILQGKYDYQTPSSVAKEFFDQLKAPHKAFFTFNHSAHSPVYEEPDRFNSIIKKCILKKP